VQLEPHPGIHPQLLRHAALNGAEGMVEAYPLAVSTQPGFLMLDTSIGQSTGQARVSESGEAPGVVRVEAVTLDRFVYEQGHPAPDLIKIDVEGYEAGVIGGAERLLAEAKPVFVCEMHNAQACGDFMRIAQKHGYLFYDIERRPWKTFTGPEALEGLYARRNPPSVVACHPDRLAMLEPL